MTRQIVHTTIIVGGGTAGWMAAAALTRFLPSNHRVKLIESEAIGTVGVGEATIPQIRLFNAGLGIDEDDFVRATQGTFKLGIEFVDWSGPDSRYLHAFGTIGRGLGLVPFHHYWLRYQRHGGGSDLWEYSASALAARAGRFARDLGRPDAPSGLAWAFQFDAALYAAYLRRYAEARNVARIEGRVVAVERDGDGDGEQIAAVKLDDGARVVGDLFIDCTGFRGLLIEQALGAGYDDWTRMLPCDRALAVPCARTAPLTPYTRATAREAGWQWRIPLQHRTGNGLVYASAWLDDDRAADILLGNLDGAPLAEPNRLRFVTGRRKRTWIGNCVALGLAAGFLEPLESTSIHLIQSGIARLLQLFPRQRPAAADIAEFNRQSEREWLAVRDFLVLHYHANGRDDPFWRACRAQPIPDSLAVRLELFRANARIVRHSDELFTEVGWLQVMLGQGVIPVAYDPIADAPSDADCARLLAVAHADAAAVAARLPAHADFIARHGMASGRTADDEFRREQ